VLLCEMLVVGDPDCDWVTDTVPVLVGVCAAAAAVSSGCVNRP